MSMLMLM